MARGRPSLKSVRGPAPRPQEMCIRDRYPGASPDVMTSLVTSPLERQFGQMPGLNQMSSTSSGGASVIDVYTRQPRAWPAPLNNLGLLADL